MLSTGAKPAPWIWIGGTKEVRTLRKREMVMLWIEKIVYCVKIFIVLGTLC